MLTSNCIVCGIEFKYYKSNKSGKYCSYKCAISSPEYRVNQSNAKKGKKLSDATKLKMSLKKKGKKHSKEWVEKRMMSRKKTFDKRGRVSTQYALIKSSKKYIDWRNSIYKRDGYKCVFCGDDRGHNLNADHIIPFSFLLKECKMTNNYDALYDIDNGRTLCHKCHSKTFTYSQKYKNQTEAKLLEIINLYWKQQGSTGDFEAYYRQSIEKVINSVKEKLDD